MIYGLRFFAVNPFSGYEMVLGVNHHSFDCLFGGKCQEAKTTRLLGVFVKHNDTLFHLAIVRKIIP